MRFQGLVSSLRNSLSSGDVVRNAILAVVIVVVVGTAVAGVVYFIHLNSPRGRLDTLLKEQAETVRRPWWVARLLPIPLLILALLASGFYMARPSGCSQCHGKSWAGSLASSPHKSVACMSCHAEQGFTGPVRQLVTYGRWVYDYSKVRKALKPQGTAVDERACLRCHGEILQDSVVHNGIRVRHSDFLETGSKCADCHNSTAHPDVTPLASKPTMSDCLICHSGKRASADCETCHVTDPLQEAPQGQGFAKVQTTAQVAKSACFKCHAVAPCIRCHGLQMPHPQGWVVDAEGAGANLHARVAFETNKEVCWRCHYDGDNVFQPNYEACKPCHSQPGLAERMHGGAGWIQEHGLEATGEKPGELADCFACHVPTLCDMCHPPSYKKKYNPVLGSDNYHRDVPLDKSLVP